LTITGGQNSSWRLFLQTYTLTAGANALSYGRENDQKTGGLRLLLSVNKSGQ